jgi:hypothetical protein
MACPDIASRNSTISMGKQLEERPSPQLVNSIWHLAAGEIEETPSARRQIAPPGSDLGIREDQGPRRHRSLIWCPHADAALIAARDRRRRDARDAQPVIPAITKRNGWAAADDDAGVWLDRRALEDVVMTPTWLFQARRGRPSRGARHPDARQEARSSRTASVRSARRRTGWRLNRRRSTMLDRARVGHSPMPPAMIRTSWRAVR